MNINDPRLTAYALGELSEADRVAMERTVAESDEATRFVAETQELAQLLRREFRAEIDAAARKPRNILPLPEPKSFWPDARWRSIGVAALFAVGCVVAAVLLSGIWPAEPRLSSASRTDPGLQMEVMEDERVGLAPNSSRQAQPFNADTKSGENQFVPVSTNPISTFAINIATASYAEVRKMIDSGTTPPRDSVRIEEMINYFPYEYPQPQGDAPFSINLEAATCPWTPHHRLVRIGLKGRGDRQEQAAIAKDVKVEVEFNPTQVASYRLLGYETRFPRRNDPTNQSPADAVVQSGHAVTALYEVIPLQDGDTAADKLQTSADLLTVKLHHKHPITGKSAMTEQALTDAGTPFREASADFRFAAAVAHFGMVLRNSPHKGDGTLAALLEWAQESSGPDNSGERAGFIELARKAQKLPF